jgi:hypothetical protein
VSLAGDQAGFDFRSIFDGALVEEYTGILKKTL